MTYERFLEIKEECKNIRLTDVQIRNCICNIKCFRYRFQSKGTEDDCYWRYLIDDFNCNGNAIYTNEEGIRNIICFVRCDVFNEEEWKEILPHIYFEEFNKEYDELVETLAPMLGRIYRWRQDLHLEFWQGIFCFGEHWAVEGLSPEQSINSKRNGEKYCSILLEMYPIIKDFISKYPDSHYTLMDRLAK